MIQKKKKQLKIVIIILICIALISIGTIWFLQTRNDNKTDNSMPKQTLDFTTKSLILKTDIEIKDTYGAIYIEKLMENMYVLEYDSEASTEKAYEQFKKDKNIEYVAPDSEYEIQSDLINDIIFVQDAEGNKLACWAGTAMSLEKLQYAIEQKTQMDNIVVAVIDSGLQTDHELITNLFKEQVIEEGYNATDRTTDVTDENGHGTMMAGGIFDGAAKNVKVLPIKMLGADGKGKFEYMIRAINYAIEKEVDVINMSFGSEYPTTDTATQMIISDAIKQATDAGVVVVVAAGNGYKDNNNNRIPYNLDMPEQAIYPALVPEAITIGAVKNNLIVYDYNSEEITNSFEQYAKPSANDLEYTIFSNYGQCIDFVAPGEKILSIYPTNLSPAGLAIGDGTSQAASYVSAAVANILSYNKNFTNDQVYEILKYYSSDLGDEGKDVHYGNGFINFNGFTECECGAEECDEIYCFGCSSLDCLFHEAAEKTLNNIDVTTMPKKTTYTEGEIFNPEGMVVTAIYSDESTETITDYEYSPTGELTTNDSVITVTYQGKTDTVSITVSKKQESEKVLTGIDVTTMPRKTTYEEGETFDPAGMIVTAIYSDESTETITDYEYSPTGELTTNDSVITVTYQGKTDTVSITVSKKQESEKVLTGIEVTAAPNKTIYTEGETFNPLGMVVTAIYNDGSREIITDYTYSPTGELTTNDSVITVTYQGKTDTVSITVNKKQEPQKVLTGIEVTTMPNKTTYTEGETFNPAGMVVIATYSDGSRKTISNYNCFPVTALTVNNDKITVSYTEEGKTFNFQIPITVNSKKPVTNNGTNNNNNSNSNNNVNNNSNTNNTSNNSNTNTTTNNTSNNSNTNKNVSIEINKVDTTIKDQNLANTGAESYIIPGIIIAIIGIVGFVKYREYKDI